MKRPTRRLTPALAALLALGMSLGCGEELIALDPAIEPPAGDADGDGYSVEDGDCDDEDATTHPDAEELCDGVDHDCDGVALDDADGDGFDLCDDCDDADGTTHPDAVEQCDGVDHDCDGEVHDDDDGDGFDVCDDCDDADAGIHPGATELCNGLDDDCDGIVTGEEDVDGDAFHLCHGDCDDSDPTINPGAPETPYDGVDQDCDGADVLDADGDGYDWDGAEGEDCDDTEPTTYPGAHESPADGVDSNCDGLDDPVLGENCYGDDHTIEVPGLLDAYSLNYADASDGPAGPGYYFDDAEFEGSAGAQVNIALYEETWMDPYLYVLDPYCTVIAEDDNGGFDEDDAYLLFEVPADGIYTIVVTTVGAWETGVYTLETW